MASGYNWMNTRGATGRIELPLISMMVGAFLVGSAALAHSDRLQMIQMHTPHAIAKFRQENPGRIDQCTGMKTWVVDHSVKAKFYFADNTSVQYTCHEEGEEGPHQVIDCHQ